MGGESGHAGRTLRQAETPLRASGALAAAEQGIPPDEAWGGWDFSLRDLLPGA